MYSTNSWYQFCSFSIFSLYMYSVQQTSLKVLRINSQDITTIFELLNRILQTCILIHTALGW